MISSLLNILFVMVIRHCQGALKEGSKGLLAALKNPHISIVLKKIYAHPEQDWNLARMARSAMMSRSSFSQKFSSFFDVGPVKYLNQIRLHKSIALLIESDISIKRIANHVGFSSAEVYIRNFQKAYKCSPVQYRRKQRGAEKI